MRSLLPVGFMVLLPLAALAQYRGMPARSAPMRGPMAMRTAPMARPFIGRSMPVRGGFHFRPSVPRRVMPFRPQGRPGFHSGHIGLTFGFGHGNFPFGVHPDNRCFSDAFFDPFFCTRTPTRFSSFVPFSSFLPFASYPYYSMPLYDESSYNGSRDTEQLERANAQVSDLTNQIEQLREELGRMQEQQSSPQAAATPAPKANDAKVEPPVSTTLVFRDGHRSQVENYAIVGNTLWVFSDQRRTKIPITELDLKYTEQVNEERGVDFTIPTSAK
ncbi:MAG TPA: hypothetical protein VJ756_12125 [Terriglobales bacterium]|nr:hypothetical protein [Terriglobales bacterium]